VTPRPRLSHTGEGIRPLVLEMCVNAGGDPGRDDYGLPPFDVEIPDDARELAREVQAYHREQRWLRRRHLARRLYGPLTRDGMVLPLLAGCLALTLVAATLLTVFTARQPMVSLRPEHPAIRAGQSSPARPGAPLVDTTLFAAGMPTPLNTLPGRVVVLALIPPRCRCLTDLTDLRELIAQASQANTLIYLVGVHNTPVSTLVAALGLKPARGLEDREQKLPATFEVAALTAVLIRPDGSAKPVVIPDRHGFEIQNDVRNLLPGGQAGASQAAPSAAASAGSGATPSSGPAASGAPTG
jgi:hypothetical protein